MATRATDKRQAEVMIRNSQYVKIPFYLPNGRTMWVKVTKMEARRIVNRTYEWDTPVLAVTEYVGGRVFMRPFNVEV